MLFKDMHCLVFGLGKAGVAASLLLRDNGADVYVCDDDPEKQVPDCENVTLENAPWEKLDYLVLSPGVPLHFPAPHAVVKLARQHNIPIICDIHLLQALQPHATYIGITGTNGKSTTTALTYHILKEAGKSVSVGGNIGTAAATLATTKQDIYVLELSSYQCDLLYDAETQGLLEQAPLARSSVQHAALLNITPDHIDRHGSMKQYADAKKALLDHATETQIIATEDAYTQAIATALEAANSNARLMCVSAADATPTRYLPGAHNAQNIAVASALCTTIGLSETEIAEGIESFTGLAHRLERLGNINNNITVVNDSKATNAIATEQALRSFAEPIFWIVGGVAKEGGIASLAPEFSRIKHAYVIGEAATDFSELLSAHNVEHSTYESLEAAAHAAIKAAKTYDKNAVILLSPACASFDQFPNFEARGDAFKKSVSGYL